MLVALIFLMGKTIAMLAIMLLVIMEKIIPFVNPNLKQEVFQNDVAFLFNKYLFRF